MMSTKGLSRKKFVRGGRRREDALPPLRDRLRARLGRA